MIWLPTKPQAPVTRTRLVEEELTPERNCTIAEAANSI
jgi:hypothetical protein